jgi:hypothetical protein
MSNILSVDIQYLCVSSRGGVIGLRTIVRRWEDKGRRALYYPAWVSINVLASVVFLGREIVRGINILFFKPGRTCNRYYYRL